MKTKGALIRFATVFGLVLVVASVVNLLWNLGFHGTYTVDWAQSFRLAIVFGVVLTWMGAREGK